MARAIPGKRGPPRFAFGQATAAEAPATAQPNKRCSPRAPKKPATFRRRAVSEGKHRMGGTVAIAEAEHRSGKTLPARLLHPRSQAVGEASEYQGRCEPDAADPGRRYATQARSGHPALLVAALNCFVFIGSSMVGRPWFGSSDTSRDRL